MIGAIRPHTAENAKPRAGGGVNITTPGADT